MGYWVRVKYDYCSDPSVEYTQLINTNHYYRENVDGTTLHIDSLKLINILPNGLEHDSVYNQITEVEFNEILHNTIDKLGINIINHKFI